MPGGSEESGSDSVIDQVLCSGWQDLSEELTLFVHSSTSGVWDLDSLSDSLVMRFSCYSDPGDKLSELS